VEDGGSAEGDAGEVVAYDRRRAPPMPFYVADSMLRAAAGMSMLLMPVVALQGRSLQRRIPRLPEAKGATEGLVPGAEPEIGLLVIGESTAAGVGAENHDEALVGQTARALAAETGRAVRWRVLGKNGATAESALVKLFQPAANVRADVAVIALGVNDSLAFRKRLRWARALDVLIGKIRERCGPIPVVLAAVPPMGSFPALPHPTRMVLGLRAAVLDRTAARLAASIPNAVHVPTPLRGGEDAAPYFASDGFHPSPRGYTVWGRALAAAAASFFRGG
jgi:lysophospholipase L1-like esterase